MNSNYIKICEEIVVKTTEQHLKGLVMKEGYEPLGLTEKYRGQEISLFSFYKKSTHSKEHPTF
jgi:hypothetical protein